MHVYVYLDQIDDVTSVSETGLAKLNKQFLSELYGHSNCKTLDVQTHYKPTETFQYTHFSSSHPLSVKKGFIKGETSHLLRTNSVKEIFKLRTLEFLTCLLKRATLENSPKIF